MLCVAGRISILYSVGNSCEIDCIIKALGKLVVVVGTDWGKIENNCSLVRDQTSRDIRVRE